MLFGWWFSLYYLHIFIFLNLKFTDCWLLFCYFSKLIANLEFLKLRPSIKLFIHLIDSRHTHLEIDVNLNDYLKRFLQPDQKILKVFTKCDKLNQSEKAKLKNEFKDSILVSNLNKFGLDSLEDIIINQTLGLDKWEEI